MRLSPLPSLEKILMILRRKILDSKKEQDKRQEYAVVTAIDQGGSFMKADEFIAQVKSWAPKTVDTLKPDRVASLEQLWSIGFRKRGTIEGVIWPEGPINHVDQPMCWAASQITWPRASTNFSRGTAGPHTRGSPRRPELR